MPKAEGFEPTSDLGFTGITIAEQWESYRRHALMPGLPAARIREIQMHFYGGALAYQALLAQRGGTPTAQQLPLIDEIHNHLQGYIEGIGAELARRAAEVEKNARLF